MTEIELPKPSDPEFEALLLSHADGELVGEEEELAEALLEASPEAQDLFDATLDQREQLRDLFAAAAHALSETAAHGSFSKQTQLATKAPLEQPGLVKGSQSHAPSLGAPTRTGSFPDPKTDSRPKPRRSWSIWLGIALGCAGGLGAAPYFGPYIGISPIAAPTSTVPRQNTPTTGSDSSGNVSVTDWRTRAATLQGLMSPATFASAPIAPEALSAALDALSPVFGTDLGSLFNSDLPRRLRLMRAQLLETDGSPMAQLAFVAEGGAAVSLFIRHRQDGGGVALSDPVLGVIQGLSRAEWRGTANDYLLIGPLDATAMADVAREFVDRLM